MTNDILDTEIYIARDGKKKWLAATNAPPYFCFEADSQKALFAKLKKLGGSLRRFIEDCQEANGERKTAQPFSDQKTKKKILVRELEDAA